MKFGMDTIIEERIKGRLAVCEKLGIDFSQGHTTITLPKVKQ